MTRLKLASICSKLNEETTCFVRTTLETELRSGGTVYLNLFPGSPGEPGTQPASSQGPQAPEY